MGCGASSNNHIRDPSMILSKDQDDMNRWIRHPSNNYLNAYDNEDDEEEEEEEDEEKKLEDKRRDLKNFHNTGSLNSSISQNNIDMKMIDNGHGEEDDEALKKSLINQIKNASIDKSKILQLFNIVEEMIQRIEETKCFEKYRIMSEDVEQLKKRLRMLEKQEEHHSNNPLNDQIDGLMDSSDIRSIQSLYDESADERDLSLRDMIVDNLSRNLLKPDNPSLIELVNVKRMNQLTMQILQDDIKNFDAELKDLQSICDQLHDQYTQRDNLLNMIFDGSYGNEKEIQLERELDSLMEERHYAEIAKIRWINGNNLTIGALKCLDGSIGMLKQLPLLPLSDFEYRYNCIKEVRDNLVRAHYNLMALQTVLQSVQLPHCKTEDVEMLNRLAGQLFNDLQNEALAQKLDWIVSFRDNIVTQHKWIKEVLNKTIKNDLIDIRQRCQLKSEELKFERSEMIHQKQEEWKQNHERLSSSNMIINNNNNNQQSFKNRRNQGFVEKNGSQFELRVDSGVDSELDETATLIDDRLGRVLASGKDSITSPEYSNMTPLLPGEKLGPIPNRNEVLGKIVQLRNQHIQEMEEFERNQKLSRVKMNQDLKEKLDTRRTRRSRLEMHNRQLEALHESPIHFDEP